ncbi:AMIN-like domain-containing (lipo)protein [Flexivirga sp. B27]
MSHTNIRGMRSKAALAVCGLTAATVIPLATSGPAQAAPYCGITWGSTGKVAAALTSDTVRGVRSGRHTCYDRLVIDLSGYGHSTGYTVRYVSSVHGPSGAPVSLAGGARIQIDVNAAASDAQGRPTYRPADPRHVVNVAGYRTFRQVAYVASFEGRSTLGLGVRARLPMRAFVIQDPGGQRLVIDVAHRW